MARRDRYRSLVWLRSLATDPPDGDHLVVGSVGNSVHGHIAILTGEMNLWLEFERQGDAYTLRCYPRAVRPVEGQPAVCASYRGPRITTLLACAVHDYREYMATPTAAKLVPLEHCRWVA